MSTQQNQPNGALPAVSVYDEIARETGYSVELIKDIKSLAASTLKTPTEFKQYLLLCKMRGFNPVNGEVTPIVRGGKVTLTVGIDTLRKRAAATGKHIGTTFKVAYVTDGKVEISDFAPTPQSQLFSVKCIVKRLFDGGVVGEFEAEARFSEYLQGATVGPNKEKPIVMLCKDSESMALRRGFPEETGGIYESAEFSK